MTALSLVPGACVQASQSIIEYLVVQPLQGLREVINGIAQAGPDLYRAASDAVVDAIEDRLSTQARENVRQGADRILAGARLLVAPVAVLLAIWILLTPGLIYLGWGTWLCIIITCLAVA